MAGEFSSDFRLWRIDLTLEPAFAAEAERDLADAEVIIMAIDGQQCGQLAWSVCAQILFKDMRHIGEIGAKDLKGFRIEIDGRQAP